MVAYFLHSSMDLVMDNFVLIQIYIRSLILVKMCDYQITLMVLMESGSNLFLTTFSESIIIERNFSESGIRMI
jgi:hypothetical protein